MNKNTKLIWKGASPVDGSPIGVFVSGFEDSSSNIKTGDLMQSWIIRLDVEPHVAVKTGDDTAICGDCPFKGSVCYVQVYRAPLAIFRSYRAGNIEEITTGEFARYLVENKRGFRFGAYGDPGMVPLPVWGPIVATRDFSTGYTHQWRNLEPGYREFLMASVDTPAQYHEAQASGWRTFRTRGADSDLLPGEFVCPASEEGGKKVTCAQCRLCDGKHEGDARRSPAIKAHGAQARKWEDAVKMLV